MKSRKAVSLFAVASAIMMCALGAFATSVDRSDAVYAARRWATSGAVLEKSLGSKVVSSETVAATNDVTLHVVRFDGGTAFVSSDTELEPIVAFTTATNFSADAGNRLWQLLKRDTIVRHEALRVSKNASLMATASAGFATQMASSKTAAGGKWAALLEGRNAQKNLMAFGATVPNKLDGVSDVRCAPLVKSQWSQTSAQSHYCYNLYTPDHDPCGCTATAMSQIMRYHAYPTNAVTARTYRCEVDGKAKDLTMQGGIYDWEKMTLKPAASSYVEENWEAIGKLTSDVGIAIKSSYTAGAGGSFVSLVSGALKEAFGYANGACIFNWDIAVEAAYGDGRVHSDTGLHNLAVREKVVYANLDAKCPVEFGVYGYGDEQIGDMDYWEGHAVVGDGYGYSEYGGEQVPYVHINLGWHGLDDAWYNIPEIHSPNSGSYIGSDGTAFTVLSAAAYNLFPTNTGNIVAGRAYDEDGDPLAGLPVTIRAAGSSEILATRVTDEKGIYAFIVPGNADYEITCEDPSRGLQDTHTVYVPKEKLEVTDATYGNYTEKDENVGNYWGHEADFEMSESSVRIEGGSTYVSLNAALAAAQDGDTLTIIRSTRLKKPVTVTVGCTVVTEPIDPSDTPVVHCVDGAAVTVSGEVAQVTFDGVAFTNDCAGFVATDQGTLQVRNSSFEGLAAVTVAEGASATFDTVTVSGDSPATIAVSGALALAQTSFASGQTLTVKASGNLSLDTGVANLVRVTLEDATQDCLTIAGSLTESIAVDARKASGDGAIFAAYTCDFATAEEAAKRLYNVSDPDLGGVAVSDSGKVKWGIVTVPIEEANCILVNENGQFGYRTFAATLRALQATGKAARITIVEDVQHTNTLSLAHDLTLMSSGGTLSFTANAGFVVTTDAELTLTNLLVSGEGALIEDCAFKVTGGAMTLEDGAVLSDFSDRNRENKKAYGCAIAVTAGSVTMKSGSRIENCSTIGVAGGAIWVGGANSTANLLGGTITGCSASAGGAVCARMKAKVNVAGDFVASDNTTTGGEKLNNVYLSKDTTFTLTEELTGSVGVSYVQGADPDRNEEGAEFVTIGSGVSAAVATSSAECFFSDLNTDLVGGYDSASQTIVWTVEEDDDGQCDPGEAGVRVTVEGEDDPRFYWCIDDAFYYVKTNATFEVKGFVSGDTDVCDCLTKDVTIDHDVRITSWKGFTYNESDIMILWRTYHAMYKVVAGGSLTLSNVKIVGACSWDEDGEDPWDDDPWCPFTPLFYEDTDPENPVEEPSIGYGLITVDGGSLTLEDGARVGYVIGNMSRSSNAITVFNGGTVTMESGSRVMQSDNQYVDDYETGCGGGILLDRSTGYFRGGAIFCCKAYRAGGLYVANGSTAYVSGDLYIDDNESWKRLFEQGANTDISDNVVVSKNSKLVLAGPLSCEGPDGDTEWAYIGVNESIAGDTNWFGYVSEDWNWDYDTLINSAAYFRHDKRSEVLWTETLICGTAVTNWNEKTQRWDARLVWEDSLSLAKGITIDGETYRGAIPAGMTVAVPTAFSVSPTTGANGKQVLSLDGGVEGCWYTVYSTEDLNVPFTVEKSVQLKVGETFEYEIDQTKTSKFYKVVAEEGLK